MEYYLDSAKIDEIRYAYKNWNISGITTNPRHIKNSGKPFLVVLKELADEFKDIDHDFPISVEINPHLNDSDLMVSEAKRVSKILPYIHDTIRAHPYFVIKLPCTESGLIAAKTLELEYPRIPTNITLVFSVSQAIQAARVGASFVSPFVGWKESSGDESFNYIKDIMSIYKTWDCTTKVIAAALRTGDHIRKAGLAGVDAVTCSLKTYRDSFYHPFTDHGLDIFRKAWDETNTSGEY